MNEHLPVSIVMPAYNAAATIGEAIDSVLAQTVSHWELIVVDDGSTDETAEIVRQYVRPDGRIRLLQQANAGGSAARNTGIAQARHDWLLFLDADDWLLPTHLEKMTEALAKDTTLNAVHCGWHRVAPDGAWSKEKLTRDQVDLFPLFAERCDFQMNACLVHRSRVAAVGGFNESLQTCQDWDFWQRIARAGTRFGAVPEALALYRTRPGSVSLNGVQLLRDGLCVISQAYAPDPRFADSPHADGLPSQEAARSRIRFACWPFGLILGSGEDPRPYLSLLDDDIYPELDPSHVAAFLFEAAVLPRGLDASGWDTLWPEIGSLVSEFLADLEEQVRAPDLAQPAQRHLERLILEHSPRERPYKVGSTWAVAVEVSQPLLQLSPPSETAVCRCEVRLEDDYLGAVEFPLTERESSPTLARVAHEIAQAFAWPILGRFFAYHLFPQLQQAEGDAGISLWRDSLHLATLPPAEPEDFWAHAWDEVGWLLFLQEVWERPAWPTAYFYDGEMAEPGETPLHKVDDALTVALAQPLPDLLVSGPEVVVTLKVGDEPVTEVKLSTPSGRVPAQCLRAVLTNAADFELCRAVVQHALLGRPLDDPATLRQRLQKEMVNGRRSHIKLGEAVYDSQKIIG